jgi:hypothetical protein
LPLVIVIDDLLKLNPSVGGVTPFSAPPGISFLNSSLKFFVGIKMPLESYVISSIGEYL